MRKFLFLALLALTFPASAQNEKLYYELNWSGIKVGEMNLLIGENEGKYDYSANIKSTGILKYFIKYKSFNRSQGLLTAAGLVPQIYNSNWTRKKHSQALEINYKNGAVEAVSRVPKNRKTHPDVAPEMLKKTYDPASAGFAVREKIASYVDNGKPLPEKIVVQVYDAKRLFDAEIYIKGYKTKKIDGKKQKLLHLVLKRTPVAGFRPNKLKDMQEGEGDPDIELFLNDELLPVWGFGKAALGIATITLESREPL